jgi:copper chaperone CopZ
MKVSSPYFHSLNGRLRIKIIQVKDSPASASELENHLLKLDGIRQLKANPTTGNVLVLYDHNRIGQAEIIDTLKALGYLNLTESGNIESRKAKSTATSAHQSVAEELTRRLLTHLAQIVMRAAFQSLISALI